MDLREPECQRSESGESLGITQRQKSREEAALEYRRQGEGYGTSRTRVRQSEAERGMWNALGAKKET